jgi:transposase
MNKHRVCTDNHTLEQGEGAAESLQRVEVITGVGRRRRWSPEAKARIVLESQQPGAVVSEVARQHGMTPQQLFGWRRETRDGGRDAVCGLPRRATAFAPIVVGSAADQLETVAGISAGAGQIEIAIADALIRLRGGCDVRALAAVLRAVRASS